MVQALDVFGAPKAMFFGSAAAKMVCLIAKRASVFVPWQTSRPVSCYIVLDLSSLIRAVHRIRRVPRESTAGSAATDSLDAAKFRTGERRSCLP